MENNNTWQFIEGQLILNSDNPDQLQLVNQYMDGFVKDIRIQIMEEMINGRTNVSNQYEQPELPN